MFLLLLPILIVTYPSYAMTDAELTAKYHGINPTIVLGDTKAIIPIPKKTEDPVIN